MTRPGLLARKMGMTRVFLDDGGSAPATLLKVDNCRALGLRTPEKDGYAAVRMAAGERAKASRALKGQCDKAGVAPPAQVREFRCAPEALADITPGATFGADHFAVGQRVDVSGVSLGRGTAGVMKRHNFRGQPASHGAKKVHRQMGSTGQCQDPGRLFKGKKMPGRMGAAKVTSQNMRVLSVHPEEGWIVVKGSVPGPKRGWLTVRDAVKGARRETAETSA